MPPEKINSLPFVTREMLSFSHASSFTLILHVIAPSTAALLVRGFTKEGPFTFRIVPVGNSSVEEVRVAIPDVPIAVSVSMEATSAVSNTAHVTLSLEINRNRSTILAQGIVTSLYGISYPHQVQQAQQQIFGPLEEVQFTNPAAGNELTTTVPNNQEWEVLGVSAFFQADANAANRTLRLRLTSLNTPLIVRPSGTAITANQGVTTVWVAGGTTAVHIAADSHEVALPSPVRLQAGAGIELNVVNIQVGDTLDGVFAIIRRTFHPNVS